MIPYGKHCVDEEDIDAVVDVLRNEFLTQGSRVPAFENALCEYTGATYCTAVNSATSGLHVACMALGVGSGDTVWTSANSFAASANCARYCSADVDFVDIDVKTGNLCTEHLAQKLIQTAAQNTLPKVLIVVHFSGMSCDMQKISELCTRYDVRIIEDAAHALGATYQSRPVGNCQYSDLAVMSFHPVKSITSAEGGAILCNDAHIAKQCQLFAKHGITKQASEFDAPVEGNWFYQQLALGFNYRLSDLHAALGITQLSRLDQFIEKRRDIAERYFDAFENMADCSTLMVPKKAFLNSSAWHLFVIQVPSDRRAGIFASLQSNGIGVNVHYIPIYKHPYYRASGFRDYVLDNVELYYSRAISLPIYPDLTAADQQRVIDLVKEFI
ncbi:MAG: UDP-4-amino-4,6-dideoxy-N-acetyl-beta-L-altrosamine transaminase [Pseudomonadota bacterium]